MSAPRDDPMKYMKQHRKEAKTERGALSILSTWFAGEDKDKGTAKAAPSGTAKSDHPAGSRRARSKSSLPSVTTPPMSIPSSPTKKIPSSSRRGGNSLRSSQELLSPPRSFTPGSPDGILHPHSSSDPNESVFAPSSLPNDFAAATDSIAHFSRVQQQSKLQGWSDNVQMSRQGSVADVMKSGLVRTDSAYDSAEQVIQYSRRSRLQRGLQQSTDSIPSTNEIINARALDGGSQAPTRMVQAASSPRPPNSSPAHQTNDAPDKSTEPTAITSKSSKATATTTTATTATTTTTTTSTSSTPSKDAADVNDFELPQHQSIRKTVMDSSFAIDDDDEDDGKRDVIVVTADDIAADAKDVDPKDKNQPLSNESKTSGKASNKQNTTLNKNDNKTARSSTDNTNNTNNNNNSNSNSNNNYNNNKLNNKNNKNKNNNNHSNKKNNNKKNNNQLPQPMSKRQRKKLARQQSARRAQSKPLQFDDQKRLAKATKRSILQLAPVAPEDRVPLFTHLPQFEGEIAVGTATSLHPAVIQLGLKYANGSISGSTARCLALLTAFRSVIDDYVTPPQRHLSRDLGKHLTPSIQFLSEIRPLSITMANTINWLKREITTISPALSEEDSKKALQAAIDNYQSERITYADELLARHAAKKIVDGDVVLTYAGSNVVEQIVKAAVSKGKKFRMVIVDSGPRWEGKVLMKKLIAAGADCTYVLINAMAYMMKTVSKVLLGAFAFMSNGHAMSRVGTASVAMVAHHHHVPVIFACELYKFCDRVQLDSICFNEIGPPEALLSTPKEGATSAKELPLLHRWRSCPRIKLLNLVYDLTPVQFITIIVTESGIMPPTSVPVVVREMQISSDLI